VCVCVRERERERESMRMDCAASEQEAADAIENSAAGRARPGAGWIEEEHAGPPPPLLSVPRRPARRSPSESRSTKETPLTGHEVEAERAQQEKIEAVVIILEHGCDLPSSVNALGLLLLSSSGGRLWRRFGGGRSGG
jgi:hypothetical protein